MNEEKALSASRIKTLETCSWVYWNNYHEKIPQTQNDGALRGTICHTIFELLINPKHKHHYDKIIKNNSIKASSSITRLVKKLKLKVGLDESNFEILDQMIMVGLKHDFFGSKDGEVVSPEYAFEIKNDKPKYYIKGFIDKPIKTKKEMHIIDYKSSKYKFRGDDLQSNIQAMMYSLASFKLWPKLKPIVKFLFLRFPKQPIQELIFTKDQIKGFEYYLEHINNYINNFSEKDAKSNFAANSEKNRWMCQMGNWKCPYKDPYEYYVKIDKNNQIINSSLNKIANQEGFRIEKRIYNGCPTYYNNKKKKDDFLE